MKRPHTLIFGHFWLFLLCLPSFLLGQEPSSLSLSTEYAYPTIFPYPLEHKVEWRDIRQQIKRGRIAIERGRVRQGIKSLFDAIEKGEAIDVARLSPKGVYNHYQIMGHAYHVVIKSFIRIEEYEEALSFFEKSYESYENRPHFNPANKATALCLKAISLQKIGKEMEAWEAISQAHHIIDIAPKLYKKTLPMYWRHLGLAYLELGAYEKAEKSYSRALALLPGKSRAFYLDAFQGVEHSRLLMGKANVDECAALESLEFAKEKRNLFGQMEALKLLYQIRKSSFQHKSALEAYEAYQRLRSVLLNPRTTKDFTAEQIYYELAEEKRAQEIAVQNQYRRFQYRINLLLGGLLAATIIAGLLLRMSHYRKKNSQMLAEKNGEILNALEEKEVLLKEIHHRVKNNLQVISSLLSLQSRQIKDPQAKKAFKEGRSRVQAMALIHQNLYQDDNLIGVDAPVYIEKLTSSLLHNYQVGEQDIRIHRLVEAINLDVETIIPLGLIINELMTNSLKYAFQGKESGLIQVELKEVANGLLLRVQDDGVGIDKPEELANSKSLGYKLIHAFKQKLKATLSIDSSAKGTHVQLLIPYK
ncbi:MAG: histidine kinase dimerization/phosphoacceptor domain -containing protein [Bacteroidota bacterium]